MVVVVLIPKASRSSAQNDPGRAILRRANCDRQHTMLLRQPDVFMTYLAHESDASLSRVHSLAICREIGERLRTGMDQASVQMPPRLVLLMARLRDENSTSVGFGRL